MDSPWRHSWNTNGPVPTALVCVLLASSVFSLSSMFTTWNMSNTVGHGCEVCSRTVYLSWAVNVGILTEEAAQNADSDFGIQGALQVPHHVVGR